jgi:DNA modification methylase
MGVRLENKKPATNQIILGDCLEILDTFPEKCIDLIFADPPYNLQLRQELYRPNMTRVDGVNEAWDHFGSFADYDAFSEKWLSACQRVLKDDGSLWVIGTYHNIYRMGAIMQNLGLWFLNDIVWIKTNPMPNFRGVRFTNAHETLIWACKYRGARYTFNHQAMKARNEGLQMRSDWVLPICTGVERIRVNGHKAHSTQKPEELLKRVILASSNLNDIVLDPFSGSGTTCAVAKKLQRQWIGIEREESYVELAQKRLNEVIPMLIEELDTEMYRSRQKRARLPFIRLLEENLLLPDQLLFFRGNKEEVAVIQAKGNLVYNGTEGSIHKIASQIMHGAPCNGWELWYFENENGDLVPIDRLRKKILEQKEVKSD